MTLLFGVASDAGTGVVVGRHGEPRIFTRPAGHRHAFQADLHRRGAVTRAARPVASARRMPV
ncbi:hypothetical protein [Streptomyces naphthomycinicus]|uniref:hypothetical protein n=1 Tax=Streptomyces naphthomycinicus TaxID=2872625 RepID=UPI001CED3936|nr:hypothetical protein [Streptomyces sp. TML10]